MKLLRPPGALAAALASAAVLVAAACGGDGGGAAGSEGAALVPADVAAFVSVDTDFDSDQWAAVEALMARFPSGDEAIQSLVDSLTSEGLDLETDIKPAFGPETSIAILELDQAQLDSEDNAPIVMLTKPTDAAKFQKLLEDGEDEAVTREVGDGWYMVADNDAIIDSVVADAGQASLADDPRYEEALADLPSESVATFYLNGQKLMASLEEEVDAALNPLFDLGAGSLVSVAVALTAEAQGLSVDGVVRTEGAPEPVTYTAVLPRHRARGRAPLRILQRLPHRGREAARDRGEAGPGVRLEARPGPARARDLDRGRSPAPVRGGARALRALRPADPRDHAAALPGGTSARPRDARQAGCEHRRPRRSARARTCRSRSPTRRSPGCRPSSSTSRVRSSRCSTRSSGTTIVLTTQASGIADLVAGAGTLADDALYQRGDGRRSSHRGDDGGSCT